jgi:hypothetical protein
MAKSQSGLSKKEEEGEEEKTS